MEDLLLGMPASIKLNREVLELLDNSERTEEAQRELREVLAKVLNSRGSEDLINIGWLEENIEKFCKLNLISNLSKEMLEKDLTFNECLKDESYLRKSLDEIREIASLVDLMIVLGMLETFDPIISEIIKENTTPNDASLLIIFPLKIDTEFYLFLKEEGILAIAKKIAENEDVTRHVRERIFEPMVGQVQELFKEEQEEQEALYDALKFSIEDLTIIFSVQKMLSIAFEKAIDEDISLKEALQLLGFEDYLSKIYKQYILDFSGEAQRDEVDEYLFPYLKLAFS
ncbi:MAG: hypothetical protein RSE00_01830 [Clostridia bacterium]